MRTLHAMCVVSFGHLDILHYYVHFMEEGTEVQEVQVTCSKVQNYEIKGTEIW